jgi:TonB family protein
MFDKLHLLSQDAPESGAGLRWRAHPYLRIAGAVPRGPAVFEWNERQRADLEALWRHPAADGARERLARDLAAFCDKLGWTPDAEMLQDAEQHGDEYLITLSAVPPELYLLPWEVIQVGAASTYLSDYACTQVRYAIPGLEPRELQNAPEKPGVLFAWSGAGGAVPHEEQAAAIQAACETGGVTFRALANADESSLQAALDAGPPSVLHLLCHGLPGPEGEPPRLKWGASDNPSEITATRLARMLRRHSRTIRLVVLSACGSGDGRGDPLFMGSTAQELHKKGIPNVVASRYPLSVPGSRVMTRALYDKLLREAWSLERSLRHTREALLRVDDSGESHAGDAYGIQLYACDIERFRSDDDTFAERPVLASYPFGSAARPVPASAPPAAELTLSLDADPGLGDEQLAERLRRVSEDESLTVAIPSHTGKGAVSLRVRTTVDGAQRLLGARRSKLLQKAVGVIVGKLILAKATSAMASTAGTAGTASTAASASAGNASATTGNASATTGTAGTATTTSPQAASSHAGAASGKAAASAGKLLTTKLVVAAAIGSVAVAGGGVAVYQSQTRSSAPIALVTEHSPTAALPAPSPPALGVAEPAAPAPSPPADAAPAEASARSSVAAIPLDAAPPDATRPRAIRPRAARIDAAPPDAAPPDAAPPDAPASASSVGRMPTAVCGNGTVEAGEQCDDGNTVAGDDCSPHCLLASAVVNYKDLNRISGKTKLDPRDETRNRMMLDGVTSVRAVVKLCIAITGNVTEATLVIPTGYAAYDQILLEAVRDWRYQPYTRNGSPRPACSVVNFVYAVK